MSNADWNITYNERISRLVMGIILLVGAALGAAKLFAVLVAVGLIGQAALGKCGIPFAVECMKKKCNECCAKKGACKVESADQSSNNSKPQS